MERETSNLVYKKGKSKSFLKTVSAFANYCDGRVIFGVTDTGKEVGVSDPITLCMDIENMISDSINPVPDFKLDIDNNKKTVTLYVCEGIYKPYCYKNKAYKRSGSATIEVTRLEFSRLILEGQNKNYEQLESTKKKLTFNKLEEEMKNKLEISSLDEDVLKTLELYKAGKTYNKAAEIIADNNDFKIMDIIRFGDNIDEIMERIIIEHKSILSAYDEAINVFSRYYKIEKIKGAKRKEIELLPETAFREVVANAIVHRTWDVDQSIQIGMFKDKIEVTSPGGLPSELTGDEYLRGRVSVLRNPIIAGVFARLGIIEKFGTGIRRINSCYRNSIKKPKYEMFENSITVTLPVIYNTYNLNSEEKEIIRIFSRTDIMTREEIEKMSGMERTKVIRLLNGLIDKGVVKKIGNGRGTKYMME